jgi:hypothetical protein
MEDCVEVFRPPFWEVYDANAWKEDLANWQNGNNARLLSRDAPAHAAMVARVLKKDGAGVTPDEMAEFRGFSLYVRRSGIDGSLGEIVIDGRSYSVNGYGSWRANQRPAPEFTVQNLPERMGDILVRLVKRESALTTPSEIVDPMAALALDPGNIRFLQRADVLAGVVQGDHSSSSSSSSSSRSTPIPVSAQIQAVRKKPALCLPQLVRVFAEELHSRGNHIEEDRAEEEDRHSDRALDRIRGHIRVLLKEAAKSDLKSQPPRGFEEGSILDRVGSSGFFADAGTPEDGADGDGEKGATMDADLKKERELEDALWGDLLFVGSTAVADRSAFFADLARLELTISKNSETVFHRIGAWFNRDLLVEADFQDLLVLVSGSGSPEGIVQFLRRVEEHCIKEKFPEKFLVAVRKAIAKYS